MTKKANTCHVPRQGHLSKYLLQNVYFVEGKLHEQIQIDNDATGYSYGVIFSRFLDQFLTQIEIEDPYIRSTHQVRITFSFSCLNK